MSRRTVIVDCDPGIDDALALLLALNSPAALDILAITTVGGNKPLSLTTKNALRILEFADCRYFSINAGAENPLIVRPDKASAFHGEDGLGNCGWPNPEMTENNKHAAIAIINAVMGHAPGTVALCCLAPLTNIALAMTLEPKIINLLDSIWIMGGSIDPEPRAEFNFRVDPHAAHLVLSSGANIRLFGLNATEQAPIAADLLTTMESDRRIDPGLIKMLSYYAAKTDCIHDLCTVAALIEPEIATYEPLSVTVEWQDDSKAGQCRISDTSPPIQVATQLDRSAILALAVQALSPSD